MANLKRVTQRAKAIGAQRINVGLTLLALVFLTVMAAAAGVRANRPKPTVNPRTETLAVLGVTPSAGSASTLVEARPTKSAPAGRRPLP